MTTNEYHCVSSLAARMATIEPFMRHRRNATIVPVLRFDFTDREAFFGDLYLPFPRYLVS